MTQNRCSASPGRFRASVYTFRAVMEPRRITLGSLRWQDENDTLSDGEVKGRADTRLVLSSGRPNRLSSHSPTANHDARRVGVAGNMR